MQKPLIINLFSGPGAGKSTAAAGIFSLLKLHGIDAELITEFAKDLTWEGRERTLNNQLYVFAKQYHKMWRVKEQVDVMVTDSPLPLSIVYGKIDKKFVMNIFNQFNNLNFFIARSKKYNPVGRNQTEEEAKELDNVVMNVLNDSKINFQVVVGSYAGINIIAREVLKMLEYGQSRFAFTSEVNYEL